MIYVIFMIGFISLAGATTRVGLECGCSAMADIFICNQVALAIESDMTIPLDVWIHYQGIFEV